MRRLACLALALGVTTCTSPGHPCKCAADFPTYDEANYYISYTHVTPRGIDVDTSGLTINMAMVDRLTDEVEACLGATFGVPPHLGPDTMRDAQCYLREDYGDSFRLPIYRGCIIVKVAADWHISTQMYAGSYHQLLPIVGPSEGCAEKGLYGGACYRRAATQDLLTIVVPPSFYLYKDPLVQIVTGCTNPWNAPKLAACMAPTTRPLDDGTQD